MSLKLSWLIFLASICSPPTGMLLIKFIHFSWEDLREFRNIAKSAKFFPSQSFSSYSCFIFIFTFEKLLTTEFFCWIDKNLYMNLLLPYGAFIHVFSWWGLVGKHRSRKFTQFHQFFDFASCKLREKQSVRSNKLSFCFSSNGRFDTYAQTLPAWKFNFPLI